MGRWDELRMVGELFGRASFALSDSPGVIELRRGRSLGLLTARIFIGVFLLPFLLLPLLLALEPDIPMNVPAALFCIVWYGTLGGFTLFMSAVLSRWRTIRVDGRRGMMELGGSGRFLWFPRRVSIPLDGVRELQIRLGPEGLRPTPFTWRLTYGGARRTGARDVGRSGSAATVEASESSLDDPQPIAALEGEFGRPPDP